MGLSFFFPTKMSFNDLSGENVNFITHVKKISKRLCSEIAVILHCVTVLPLWHKSYDKMQ